MPHHHHHHKKNPVEDSIKLVQEEERTSSFSHKVATHEKQPRATATTPLAASSGAALERNFLKTLLNMNSSPQSSSSSLEISSENSESCSNSRRLEGELLDILPFHEYSRSPHLQHFIHYSVILKYIPSSSSASSPKTKHCFNPTAVLATHLQRFVHYLHRLLLHEAELTNEEDIADLLCTRILKPLVAIWCDPVFIAHCRDQVHSCKGSAVMPSNSLNQTILSLLTLKLCPLPSLCSWLGYLN